MKSSHLTGRVDLHCIFLNNHTKDHPQFDLEEINGSLYVTNILKNVDLKIGDKLLKFNHHDLRGKHLSDYNSLLKQCKPRTLSECLFVIPPHPPEVLEPATKVGSVQL